MKMIICAALLPIGLVLAASGLISLVRMLLAHHAAQRSVRDGNDDL